jgi:hypothetical protein
VSLDGSARHQRRAARVCRSCIGYSRSAVCYSVEYGWCVSR